MKILAWLLLTLGILLSAVVLYRIGYVQAKKEDKVQSLKKDTETLAASKRIAQAFYIKGANDASYQISNNVFQACSKSGRLNLDIMTRKGPQQRKFYCTEVTHKRSL